MAEFNYTNEFNQVRELVFPEKQVAIDCMKQDELKAHWTIHIFTLKLKLVPESV